MNKLEWNVLEWNILGWNVLGSNVLECNVLEWNIFVLSITVGISSLTHLFFCFQLQYFVVLGSVLQSHMAIPDDTFYFILGQRVIFNNRLQCLWRIWGDDRYMWYWSFFYLILSVIYIRGAKNHRPKIMLYSINYIYSNILAWLIAL